MTTYYQIKGQKVPDLTSDPSVITEGQVWYNNTSDKLKFFKSFNNVWATAASKATTRSSLAGAGTQTAALGFGSSPTPPNVLTNNSEEYDGFTWTAGGNMVTGRSRFAGCGVQTLALGFGGFVPPATYSTATEEYNGTSWTTGGSMATGRRALAGLGVESAALAIGGFQNGPALNNVEEYNGSTWTAGGAYPASPGVNDLAACGTESAGLAFGGDITLQPISAVTSEYNGSTWTAGGNLTNAKSRLGGCGTQTAALGFGGYNPSVPGSSTSTEKYDGASWTTTGSLNSPLNSFSPGAAGAGTQSAGLAFRSNTTTEEFIGSNTTLAVEVIVT